MFGYGFRSYIRPTEHRNIQLACETDTLPKEERLEIKDENLLQKTQKPEETRGFWERLKEWLNLNK